MNQEFIAADPISTQEEIVDFDTIKIEKAKREIDDIVNNTDFKGTVIVGVTPGLLFSTTYPKAMPWERPQAKVNYYQDRTYAQRLNFLLSIPLQQNLAFMSADEEKWADDIDLKALLKRIKIGDRIESKKPPFYNFGEVTIDRNMSMTQRTVTDTAFANSITEVSILIVVVPVCLL